MALKIRVHEAFSDIEKIYEDFLAMVASEWASVVEKVSYAKDGRVSAYVEDIEDNGGSYCLLFEFEAYMPGEEEDWDKLYSQTNSLDRKLMSVLRRCSVKMDKQLKSKGMSTNYFPTDAPAIQGYTWTENVKICVYVDR